MQFVQHKGKQIAYTTGHSGIEGARKTLVLVHGSGGSHLHWNYQRQRFQKSYNVVMVDLPGHGQAGVEGEASIEAYASHLLHLLESLPGDRFCLFGHSLGGAIALTITLRYPSQVEALVLVGTGARLRVRREILTGINERFEETVRLINGHAFSPEAPAEVVQRNTEAMLKTTPAVLYGDLTSCDRFDIMDKVGQIQVPTLVVSGRDDVLTPPRYAYYLAERIKDAKVEIIGGAGHMVMIERPDQFNRRVLEFLGTLDEQAA